MNISVKKNKQSVKKPNIKKKYMGILLGCTVLSIVSSNISLIMFSEEKIISKYLNKVWIVEDQNTDGYGSSSLVFISIENNVMRGKFMEDGIALRETASPNVEGVDFEGEVKNGKVQFQFENKMGEIVNVFIEFTGKDELSVIIRYGEEKEQHTYYPYNLSQEKCFQPQEELIFETDLDSWGMVYFIPGEYQARHPYPQVYITDEDRNILYRFSDLTNGFEISEISVKDMNGDKLKDVTITICLSPHVIQRNWYQEEDGTFILYSMSYCEE